MQEAFETTLRLLADCWRFRWWGVLTTWVVAIVGWTVVAAIPNQYEATAKVYVDTESFLEPLLEGITVDSMDVGEKMALVATRLLSGPVLERVAREVEVSELTDGLSLTSYVMELRTKVNIHAEQLSRTAWPPRPPNLYTLGARDGDPQRALLIVSALLDAFVEDAIGSTKQDTGAAEEFLRRQIDDHEAKLVEIEQQLTEFRQANMDSLPERGQSYFSRLQSERDLLSTAELSLEEERYRLHSIRSQLEGVSPVQRSFSASGEVVLSPLEQRLQAQRSRLDELLLLYTDSHPEVVRLNNSIAQLEESLAAESKETNQIGSSSNPMYQELRLQLGQVEANIAALEVRRNEYLRRITDLQSQVETLPQIEAELAALTRDYEITETNYNKLLDRFESAQLRSEANQTGQNVNFRIVEPPVLPSKPFFPNRLMFSALATVAAISAGIGTAFLISQIRPVFTSPAQLTSMYSWPVIGSISMSGAADRSIFRGEYLFFASVALLLGAYAGVAFLFIQNIQFSLF